MSGATSVVQADVLRMHWDQCDGPGERTFVCTENVTDHALVVSLTTAAEIDSLLAVEVVVDVQVQGGDLSDWWALDPKGCRFGQLRADTDFSLTSACTDAWLGAGAGQIQGFVVGMPRGGPGQARIHATAGVPSNQMATLTSGAGYDLLRVVVGSARSAGPNVCSGCVLPACLVVNSVRYVRPVQAEPLTDVAGDSGSEAWARWQAGTAGDCLAVPVRNKTWGAIKGFYR